MSKSKNIVRSRKRKAEENGEENDEETYTVEKILKHRINPKTLQCEVFLKWEGYEAKDNSWVPFENICHCMPHILAFEKTEHAKLIKPLKHTLPPEKLTDLGNFKVHIKLLNKLIFWEFQTI